jgi:hypothetical protein
MIGTVASDKIERIVAFVQGARATRDHEQADLWFDPLMARPEAWMVFAGAPAEFIVDANAPGGQRGAVQNPLGKNSEILTRDLIAIDPAGAYQVESSVRQVAGGLGGIRLAIAWYDQAGRLLPAGAPTPAGAGEPAGWDNGTFSYFALHQSGQSSTWTTYRHSFGAGQAAAIPPAARFVRLGALVNNRAAPDVIMQMTNVRLWAKPARTSAPDGTYAEDLSLMIYAPDPLSLFTPASQAAAASHHWPVQQLASDLSGAAEIANAARAAHGRLVGPGLWWVHRQGAPPSNPDSGARIGNR